jgi:hypothetical protein
LENRHHSSHLRPFPLPPCSPCPHQHCSLCHPAALALAIPAALAHHLVITVLAFCIRGRERLSWALALSLWPFQADPRRSLCGYPSLAPDCGLAGCDLAVKCGGGVLGFGCGDRVLGSGFGCGLAGDCGSCPRGPVVGNPWPYLLDANSLWPASPIYIPLRGLSLTYTRPRGGRQVLYQV